MGQATNSIQACQQRLIEADHHIETGHYRSAVESAAGGAELLLQGLFDNLLSYLNDKDFTLKLHLEGRLNDYKGPARVKGTATFKGWIDFFEKDEVFDEMVAAFSCQFNVFNVHTLHTLRLLRNKCVHENYWPSSDEAHWVRNTVAVFLRETKCCAVGDEGKATMIHDLTEEWRQTWIALIDQWIVNRPNSQEAEMISSLLDQLMLITGLIADNRVEFALKPPLIWAVYYVIDPNDLIPEGRDSVEALIDDAAVLTFTLSWFIRQAANEPKLMRDHWPEETKPVEFIENMYQFIVENHDAMFSDDIWPAIREIAEVGPQVVWKHRHSTELPSDKDVADAYDFISEEPNHDSWYDVWRERVQDWVFENLNAEIGEVVFAVPDLFMLIVRLLRDNRVPAWVKVRLAAASAYVVSPFDLIPEGLLGVVGLTDDAGALALIGFWLVNVIKIDGNILREHWPGASDPVAVIEELHNRIHNNAEAIFGGKLGIWKNLQQRFGGDQHDGKTGLLGRIRRLFGKGS